MKPLYISDSLEFLDTKTTIPPLYILVLAYTQGASVRQVHYTHMVIILTGITTSVISKLPLHINTPSADGK